MGDSHRPFGLLCSWPRPWRRRLKSSSGSRRGLFDDGHVLDLCQPSRAIPLLDARGPMLGAPLGTAIVLGLSLWAPHSGRHAIRPEGGVTALRRDERPQGIADRVGCTALGLGMLCKMATVLYSGSGRAEPGARRPAGGPARPGYHPLRVRLLAPAPPPRVSTERLLPTNLTRPRPCASRSS